MPNAEKWLETSKSGKGYFKLVVIASYYWENIDLDRKKCYLALSIGLTHTGNLYLKR